MKRYAIVKNARTCSEAEAYLPDNYRVIYEHQGDTCARCSIHTSKSDHIFQPKLSFVIEGSDSAGWTLDDYVIPRYASGLIQAEEIDLSHPIMKEVPLL